MEEEGDLKPQFEIRVILRSNRDEDIDLYNDYKTIRDELDPIRDSEIGKMLIKRGIENWKEEKKKKINP